MSWIVAWSCAGVGVVHAGLVDAMLPFVAGTQLLTGYFGPTVFFCARGQPSGGARLQGIYL